MIFMFTWSAIHTLSFNKLPWLMRSPCNINIIGVSVNIFSTVGSICNVYIMWTLQSWTFKLQSLLYQVFLVLLLLRGYTFTELLLGSKTLIRFIELFDFRALLLTDSPLDEVHEILLRIRIISWLLSHIHISHLLHILQLVRYVCKLLCIVVYSIWKNNLWVLMGHQVLRRLRCFL